MPKKAEKKARKTTDEPKRKRSYFFRRLVSLTFVTTILFALLTGIVFFYASRNIMIDETIKQLRLSARSISSILSLSRSVSIKLTADPSQGLVIDKTAVLRGEDTAQFINLAVLSGSRAHIYNSAGELEYLPDDEQELQLYLSQHSDSILDESGSTKYLPTRWRSMISHQSQLNQLLPTVLSGQEVEKVFSDFVVVGVPVFKTPNSSEVSDVVFISRPYGDVFDVRNTLYSSLILAMAVVALIMLLSALIVSRRISKPVYNMRDIALSMARGNFKAKADESMDGEMGELAESLNFLSSELSKTIRALQLERNRLLSILDGLSEGILAINADMEITHINPALEMLFGPAPKDKMLTHYIGDEDLWFDMQRVVEAGDRALRSMQINDIILRISISPLEDDSKEIAGAVALFRDVTESERLEQVRRDYVANVSHELRTPASSIQSLAETLQDGLITSEEDRQRYYGYMLREAQRLSRLINDLLELSRLQSGSVAFQQSCVDMEELLMDLAERFRMSAKNHNVIFSAHNIEDCPDAYSNGDRIDQILVVLLDNAFKFTPEGGEVSLSARWDKESIYLTVSDTGIGVASADLPHLFDRFYKVDKAHTGNGTGLGLSIASEVAQLLDVSLEAKSEEGKGSSFTLCVKRFDASIIEIEALES